MTEKEILREALQEGYDFLEKHAKILPSQIVGVGFRMKKALADTEDTEISTGGFYDFCRDVNIWQRKTFPKSTVDSVLSHLESEVNDELLVDKTAEEAADVLLLLIAFADKIGFDLYGEAQNKFGIIQKRKWGKPNEKGFIEHIRSDGTKPPNPIKDTGGIGDR